MSWTYRWTKTFVMLSNRVSILFSIQIFKIIWFILNMYAFETAMFKCKMENVVMISYSRILSWLELFTSLYWMFVISAFFFFFPGLSSIDRILWISAVNVYLMKMRITSFYKQPSGYCPEVKGYCALHWRICLNLSQTWPIAELHHWDKSPLYLLQSNWQAWENC